MSNVVVEFGDGLTMDVHLPDGAVFDETAPAVVMISGYPDDGFQRVMGHRFKDMPSVLAWAKAINDAGLGFIAATNRDAVRDALALIDALQRRTIALLSVSGNAPTALSLLLRDAPRAIAAAALVYPYLIDLDGDDAVSKASATFKFANACAGKTADDVRDDVPLLLVRAGADECAGLNAGLDRFVAAALQRNWPLTLINLPNAPHAFDVSRNDATSQTLLRDVAEFLRRAVTASPAGAPGGRSSR